MQVACRAQGTCGVVGPSVTYSHGEMYTFVAYHHFIFAYHLGFGHVPFPVSSRNDKSRQIILSYQWFASLWGAEVDVYTILFHGEMMIYGSRVCLLVLFPLCS